jgi:hypothetical protein
LAQKFRKTAEDRSLITVGVIAVKAESRQEKKNLLLHRVM